MTISFKLFSEYSGISFDLSNLLPSHDLNHLVDEFSNSEIMTVIKGIPVDHAPGPDGFNGKFIQKSWSIIKDDFLRLFRDFFGHITDLTSINNSYIALVPKKDHPESVDDYRPISLLNYSVKCITKLLATRLQSCITDLIHPNQYGFIKSRTIQDCLAWTFQFLHLCHHSKKEIVILKLDFEKAFDKIEHQTILEVLKHKGFPDRWNKWMEGILGSGNSSVLLNGIPGKPFKCKRGVRQGDPLSPLLFVLAADLLQSIINKAWQEGVLNHPLSNEFEDFYPIVQYADDTLLILPADARQLFILKGLLRSFSDSTGLNVNFNKSCLLPINISEEKLNHLSRSFGCKTGTMPFTYLGLPVGTTRPSVQDFTPLVTKLERRLSGVSKFLSYHGRLLMVNSVLTALPTYYMCTLIIPPTVVEQIDRFRKHCIWSKGDINRKGTCLVAWEPMCRSKEEGGLAIINIQNQNSALLMKFLDKFYNHSEIPWVKLTWNKLYHNENIPPHRKSPCGSFWWKDIIKLFSKYSEFASSSPCKGNSISLWHDNWCGEIIEQKFPHLYSYCRKKHWSIKFFIEKDLSNCYFLPLSEIAADQLSEIDALLMERTGEDHSCDTWTYDSGPTFSSKRAYKHLQGHKEASPIFKWIWEGNNLGKHKFFAWLLVKDRLSTRNVLKRKKMQLSDYSCVLCPNGVEETCFHLFFECPFSLNCWNLININWNFNLQPLDMLIQARTSFGSPIFREIFITACWIIWKERNGIIFDNKATSPRVWKIHLKEELGLVCIKAKKRIAEPLKIWCENRL